MDCAVPSCKCTCHRQYPQDINIKELMLQQIEKEYSSEKSVVPSSGSEINTMLLFGNNDEENEKINNQMFDSDPLWERRLRIHSGQEKPLSYEDYHNQFPKQEEIKKQLGTDSFDFDEDSKSNELWERRRRIHSGQEKPLSHEDYRDQFPKLEEIKKQIGLTQVENTTQKEASKLNEKVVSSQQYLNNKQKDNIPPIKEYFVGPKPVPLNPLHRLKIKERDQVLRDIYSKTLKNIKNLYSKLDEKSEQFKEYINKEADRQLELWMEANK